MDGSQAQAASRSLAATSFEFATLLLTAADDSAVRGLHALGVLNTQKTSRQPDQSVRRAVIRWPILRAASACW